MTEGYLVYKGKANTSPFHICCPYEIGQTITSSSVSTRRDKACHWSFTSFKFYPCIYFHFRGKIVIVQSVVKHLKDEGLCRRMRKMGGRTVCIPSPTPSFCL